MPSLNQWTVHRLLLSCLTVASTFISDARIEPCRAAKVGGVSQRELRALQLEVFAQLSFQCCFTADELEDVSAALLRTVSDAASNATGDVQKSLDHPGGV